MRLKDKESLELDCYRVKATKEHVACDDGVWKPRPEFCHLVTTARVRPGDKAVYVRWQKIEAEPQQTRSGALDGSLHRELM